MFTFFDPNRAKEMKLTEKKRKDILDAAIQEFREQGFPAARVNRIAELAEVSKRTLYKHFESKEVLFQAITDILLDEIAAAPRLRYHPEAPLRAQLIAAGALRQGEPGFAAGQLLSMVKHFLVWPQFLLGTQAGENAGSVIADCVDMFLAHYSPES